MCLGSAAFTLWGSVATPASPVPTTVLRVAGVQLEFPTEKEVLLRLTELTRKKPEAELLVLPEYTFTEPISQKVKDWCLANQKYLLVCGQAPATGGQFYNTAFVIGPSGETLFSQAKAVPIQFFKDGLPAATQAVWESPWGKLGICICYDLSYARVTDALVRQGAQALIVPTMDVADWGLSQHVLHGRIAPVRAKEYGLPIFRLASSGISQAVDRTGTVVGTAPFPGPGEILSAPLSLSPRGRLPIDRWLAPLCMVVTTVIIGGFSLLAFRKS
jgi:apolipoprotein N-acyltransferase